MSFIFGSWCYGLRSGSEAEMLMECGRRDLETVDCISFLCAFEEGVTGGVVGFLVGQFGWRFLGCL